MTTASSPTRTLRAQADKIAMTLKAAERGDRIDAHDPSGKIAAARAADSVTFAIVMDDKVLQITATWDKVREMIASELSDYVLEQMMKKGT